MSNECVTPLEDNRLRTYHDEQDFPPLAGPDRLGHGSGAGPDRSTDTWENFIQRHGETLWAVDFFSVRSITAKGFQHLYVMVFLCMKTREIIVSPSTMHPNSAWVKQQTEMFLNETAGRAEKPVIVMHDRDTKFTTEFVAALEARGVRSNALPKASPNLNGRCERVIQTIKLECLRKFLIFGQQHLDHILREFTEYYNHVRSHTERSHLPPIHSPPDEVPMLESKQIVVKSYVGGLVKSLRFRRQMTPCGDPSEGLFLREIQGFLRSVFP